MCYNKYRKKERYIKMLKHEIEKRIEELEERKFYLAMKDRWDFEDYKLDTELFNEIRKLKEMLDK